MPVEVICESSKKVEDHNDRNVSDDRVVRSAGGDHFLNGGRQPNRPLPGLWEWGQWEG
jgi:hypothetical protein